MWIAYLDESQRQSHYFVGAALAPVTDWETIDDRVDATRRFAVDNYGVPGDVEFHGHPLMNSKHGWEPLAGRHRETGDLYLRALSAVDGTALQYFFRGVDVARLRTRYRYPWPPHVICMVHILERIDEFAQARGIPKVIVLADECSEEKQLTEQLERDQLHGTMGYRPSRLSRISSPLVFAPSAEVNGLQVVDLALYAMQRRFFVATEKHRKAQRIRERLLMKVDPRTHHSHVWRP